MNNTVKDLHETKLELRKEAKEKGLSYEDYVDWNRENIRKNVEKKFLKLRGWKSWGEYDKVQESTELDKNIREELIERTIDETLKEMKKYETTRHNK